MIATVHVLPTIRRDAERENSYPVMARLPRIVAGRLKKLAEQWDLSPNEAAEQLLIEKINEHAGVKRR